VTEWREYRLPDFPRLKRVMKEPAIFDGRNVWSPADVRAAGFAYSGIGRP
jgi:UDPglucose 6-dehydrogenase